MEATKGKRGRPGRGHVVLLVRVEPEQHTALKALSEETGAPMTHHVRRAVSDYLLEWSRERSTSGRPRNIHRVRKISRKGSES